MGSDRGWFESDEDYQRRRELEKLEEDQAILRAAGKDETKHWFEDEDEYRSRLAVEANQEVLKSTGKDEMTKGIFEEDDDFHRRIILESNQDVLRATGRKETTQRLFESDEDFHRRTAHEMNQAVLKSSGKYETTRPWGESDSEFRHRTSMEAEEDRNRIRREMVNRAYNPPEEEDVSSDDDYDYDDDPSSSVVSPPVADSEPSFPQPASSVAKKPEKRDDYAYYLDVLKGATDEGLLLSVIRNPALHVNFKRAALSKIDGDCVLRDLYWETREKRGLGEMRMISHWLSPEEVLARITNPSDLLAIEQAENQKRCKAVEAMDHAQLIKAACYHEDRLLCMMALQTLCYRKEYDALPYVLASAEFPDVLAFASEQWKRYKHDKMVQAVITVVGRFLGWVGSWFKN